MQTKKDGRRSQWEIKPVLTIRPASGKTRLICSSQIPIIPFRIIFNLISWQITPIFAWRMQNRWLRYIRYPPTLLSLARIKGSTSAKTWNAGGRRPGRNYRRNFAKLEDTREDGNVLSLDFTRAKTPGRCKFHPWPVASVAITMGWWWHIILFHANSQHVNRFIISA